MDASLAAPSILPRLFKALIQATTPTTKLEYRALLTRPNMPTASCYLDTAFGRSPKVLAYWIVAGDSSPNYPLARHY